jgi:hypothetical protein
MTFALFESVTVVGYHDKEPVESYRSHKVS